MYMYIHVYMRVCVYIYIEREKECLIGVEATWPCKVKTGKLFHRKVGRDPSDLEAHGA